jgi:hypothetical protein
MTDDTSHVLYPLLECISRLVSRLCGQLTEYRGCTEANDNHRKITCMNRDFCHPLPDRIPRNAIIFVIDI